MRQRERGADISRSFEAMLGLKCHNHVEVWDHQNNDEPWQCLRSLGSWEEMKTADRALG